MKIAIDISCLLNTTFMSGIQRVVVETTLGLIEKGHDIVLLKYKHESDKFYVIDTGWFVAKYKNEEKIKKYSLNDEFTAFNSNLIFFDIDSTWSLDNKKRSVLFPWLKERGVKIVSYIYDIIPLDFPEYADQKLMYDFAIYVMAILQNADIVLTETESGVKSIKKLCKVLNIEVPQIHSTWLGVDGINTSSRGEIRDDVSKVIKKKYILMVGTIEPRKNHRLVLDAFDKRLFDEGYDLVFAGREGWNISEFLQRIRKHPLLGNRFFYFEGLDDNNINELYNNAYILAFPSYAEGFGLPIIEAFQHGLPVIGADVDVTKEVAGEYGVYFAQDDSDDFIEKVLLFANEKYEEYKKKLSGYEMPTWESMICRIDTIIHDL